MMDINPRIPKLREEIARNKQRITKLQEQNRTAEKQLRELENLEAAGVFRAIGCTLEEFFALVHGTAPHETEDREHDEV